MTQRVVYSVAGQLLRHTVPGTVASATYEIVDLAQAQDDADRVLASGSADVPAYTMTLTASAGPAELDPYSVSVDTTTGAAVGDSVLLAADSATELLEVLSLDSTSVQLRSALAASYTTGDTVTGATISAPVPAGLYDFEDALDDQRPLGVVWSYTFAGLPVSPLERISLLRTTPSTLVTDASRFVRSGYHDMSARMRPGIDVFAPLCASLVETDLRVRGERPELLLLGEPGAWLLHDRIVWEMAKRGYTPNTRDLGKFIDETKTSYSVRLEALVIGTRGTDTIVVDTETTTGDNPNTAMVSPIAIAF